MLVFGLALPAQAHEGVKSSPCHDPAPSTGTMTGVVDAYDSGLRTDRNHRIFWLHRVTVSNGCQRWGSISMYQTIDGNLQPLFIIVAPGVARTFAHRALEKAGVWLHPYTNWGVHAPRWATLPCSWESFPGTKLWVLPDGRLSKSPPPECVVTG